MSSSRPHAANSTNSAIVVGRTEPRRFTPPIRDLTEPGASYGPLLIDFAERIGFPFTPWQKWLALHMGELLADGSPRFRIVLVLVGRQNGKTVFSRVITLFWMFVDCAERIIGTSSNRQRARETWFEIIKMAEEIGLLAEELDKVHHTTGTGQEDFWNVWGSHLGFAAPNRKAGRGATLNRVILDELREHRNRDVWSATIPAGNAVDGFQALCISNEGDLHAVVLHEEVDAALDAIATGDTDVDTFVASWSVPPGAAADDLEALSYSNPNLNIGTKFQIRGTTLVRQARTAMRIGGEALATFRTEVLCERVTLLNPAIDPMAWEDCGTDEPLDLAGNRNIALCFDVAPSLDHATACVAALIDGVTHVQVAGQWWGENCTAKMREELPDLARRVRPRVVAHFPKGPSAAVAVELGKRKGPKAFPGRIVELTSDIEAVCMGMAEATAARQVSQPRDPLLDQHTARTQKLPRGKEGAWSFTRAGSEPVDASFAAAGAVHAARTMPQLREVVIG